MRSVREKDFYPIIEVWLRNQYRCFTTHTCVGTSYSQVDVFGVRDIGGNLSGEVESIAVEVKGGSERFATACGQAAAYRVYANRVYLAAVRPEGFEPLELQIASKLELGLIQIKGKMCKEVLSSPQHSPITSMSLQLMNNIGLAKCQLCNTFFRARMDVTPPAGKKRFSPNFARSDRINFDKALEKALGNKFGMAFWNSELSNRKKEIDPDQKSRGSKRYLCYDCLWLLSQIAGVECEA